MAATKQRRRTFEELTMQRAEEQRAFEEVIQERDEAHAMLDRVIEQHKETLAEFDKLSRDEIAKLRADLAHKSGELEALRRYIAIVQTDHSVAAHFAAGAAAGLEHIERQAEALLETIRSIHAKAHEAADQAHEQGELEQEEQAHLPAPIGAPGTAAADDRRPAPKFLTHGNHEENGQ
jgi:uncharacterized protein YqeY